MHPLLQAFSSTLQRQLGATHFLTKTLDRVSTEMSLHVLAYIVR